MVDPCPRQQGNAAWCLAQHSVNSIDALHVKFFVVIARIQLARDRGCRSVHIETDFAILVNKFNRIEADLSVLGAQVEHSRYLLRDFGLSCTHSNSCTCGYAYMINILGVLHFCINKARPTSQDYPLEQKIERLLRRRRRKIVADTSIDTVGKQSIRNDQDAYGNQNACNNQNALDNQNVVARDNAIQVEKPVLVRVWRFTS
ncbi:hypothetical protein V6N11_056990 [Hibiscus sabdariffa]|uniref:RNase H type-1 domain-containing protein n=1 Tax=Hibiscus sabdariffa TaxID=183260 RepID=A0ABR2T622_9ROSI